MPGIPHQKLSDDIPNPPQTRFEDFLQAQPIVDNEAAFHVIHGLLLAIYDQPEIYHAGLFAEAEDPLHPAKSELETEEDPYFFRLVRMAARHIGSVMADDLHRGDTLDKKIAFAESIETAANSTPEHAALVALQERQTAIDPDDYMATVNEKRIAANEVEYRKARLECYILEIVRSQQLYGKVVTTPSESQPPPLPVDV